MPTYIVKYSWTILAQIETDHALSKIKGPFRKGQPQPLPEGEPKSLPEW